MVNLITGIYINDNTYDMTPPRAARAAREAGWQWVHNAAFMSLHICIMDSTVHPA